MNHAPRNPRYFVSLGDDGSFLVWDRKRLHNQTARYDPREFVSGQAGYNPRTSSYPDYVHGKLWALHESAQRARNYAAYRERGRVLGTTRVTEGAHVTLSGRSVRSVPALVEHVTV